MSSGQLKINWAKSHMPILKTIEDSFLSEKPFSGLKVGITLHLEAKTAYLAQVFKSGGAEVAICGSNPLSTQDDVMQSLKDDGIYVYGHWGVNPEEFKNSLNRVLDHQPHLIIDDGGDLTCLLHRERESLLVNVLGSCEETTTGIRRIKALENNRELRIPVIAVNDALCKHLFDNRYGTGQSSWDGILRTTNINIAGKKVVIIGYGWVGKGIALRGKGMGANVVVTEIDSIKALEAYMDGFEVLSMNEAARIGDIFITATGNINVIDRNHFEIMKDNAVLCNAGHFDVEINMVSLKEISKERKIVRKNITQYILKNGKRINVLGEGRLVNLACADGHPIEIMDLSFAIQSLSALYLLRNSSNLEKILHPVPEEIDNKVSSLALKTMNIQIDTLSEEQIEYLKNI